MKQFMIDMMLLMMPLMKPLVWLGVGAAIVGVLMILARLLLSSDTGGATRLASRVLMGLGVFFLACQVTGYFLGMPPKINFGDFDKMEFILVPFWQIGAAFLVSALLFGLVGGRTRMA